MHNTKGSQKRVTAADSFGKEESGLPRQAGLLRPSDVSCVELPLSLLSAFCFLLTWFSLRNQCKPARGAWLI